MDLAFGTAPSRPRWHPYTLSMETGISFARPGGMGAIDFVFNPAMADKVPAAVKEKVEALKAQIKNNEVAVPKDEF